MNWFDLVIILYFSLGFFDGYRRGLFQGIGNLLGFSLGFVTSLLGYHWFASVFLRFFFKNIPASILEIISFALLFGLISIFISFIFSLLIKFEKIEMFSGTKYNNIGGLILAIFTSWISIGAILLFLSILPQNFGFGKILDNSFVAPRMISGISGIYQNIESKVYDKLPQLIKYPEQAFAIGEYQKKIESISDNEWEALDGSLCYNCGGHVKYEGLKNHIIDGKEVISPYYVCTKCGRHSDSCQTFQGYHKLYSQCPAVLAKQGMRFDCGMWSNGNFVKPKGTCPIDGNIAEEDNHLENSELVIKSFPYLVKAGVSL